MSAPKTDVARLSRLAAEHAGAGRRTEAVAAWEQVCALAPGRPEPAAALGAALLEAGRLKDALAWLAGALARHGPSADLLRMLARALGRNGKRREAAGALFAALERSPDDPVLHEELGHALYNDDASALALPHARFAFDKQPNISTGALLISVLLDLEEVEQALQVIEAAPGRGADRSAMLVLQSLWLQTFGRGAEAIAAAREAVALALDSDIARHQLGALLLLHGQLTPEAWSLYESRAGLLATRKFPAPGKRWNGEDLAGRTLLIHAEQGFGDTLQFIRYVPLAAERARAARVVVAVQPALARLLQGTPGADELIPGGGPLPGFDLYCPMLCLPGILGTTLDTIPPAIPYARPLALRRPDGHLRVGLAWAGNPDFADDRRRSIKPDRLASLGSVPGVEFHCLQFEKGENRALPFPMIDAMQGVKDFADTADRIAQLDLVITVDTSIAHLAATMGKPVWMMSRLQGCWRWLLDRTDTPWYPTMRIYRQPRLNDWDSVITEIRHDLPAWVAAQKVDDIRAA